MRVDEGVDGGWGRAAAAVLLLPLLLLLQFRAVVRAVTSLRAAG